MKRLPRGVWSVMLTPFHEDGSIDLDGLKHVIDFYIENGCTGLFAACSSSEVMHLSKEEIVTLCRETVRHANGRARIVGGAVRIGSLEEIAQLVKEVADTGIEVPVITTNQLCKEGDSAQVWADNFHRLLDMTDGPLGIYESPFPFKRLLTPAEMKGVADSGRVVFHKDTCCDSTQIAQKLEVVRGSALSFYNANVDTLVDSLHSGAAGYCGTASNFYPDVMKYICDHYDDGASVEAAADFIIRGEDAFKETYPLAGKYFLRLRGVDIALRCRMPLKRAFVKKDEQMLADLFDEMNRTLELCDRGKTPAAVVK